VNEDWHWFVLDVNPEPWAIGDLSVGRRGGKVFPMVGRNNQLHSYKEAIKEELGDPGLFIEGPIELRFWFWRRRDDYKTPQARTHRKHEADVTNMQKATEDALQGVLFKNDKDVNDVHSVVVEQGPDVTPRVVVAIRAGTKFPRVMEGFPSHVASLLDEMDGNGGMSNLFTEEDGVF
jgi:Holliday junction resolvase RusA-like endonuclease